MYEHHNLKTAIELLLLERGMESTEAEVLDMSTSNILNLLHKLEDRFTLTELRTVDSYLEDMMDMPNTFARTVRGQAHPADYAACIPKVLDYMREIVNDNKL